MITRFLRNQTQCGRQRISQTSRSSATPTASSTISSFSQLSARNFSGENPPDRLNRRSTQLARPLSQPSIALTIALAYPVCVMKGVSSCIVQACYSAAAALSVTVSAGVSGSKLTSG